MFKNLKILVKYNLKVIYIDSKSVKFLVKNSMFYKRTKHINI